MTEIKLRERMQVMHKDGNGPYTLHEVHEDTISVEYLSDDSTTTYRTAYKKDSVIQYLKKGLWIALPYPPVAVADTGKTYDTIEQGDRFMINNADDMGRIYVVGQKTPVNMFCAWINEEGRISQDESFFADKDNVEELLAEGYYIFLNKQL